MLDIIQGDALAVMQDIADGSFDALITDPPYCSGGSGREYQMTTAKKYTNTKGKSTQIDFADGMMPRTWRQFTCEWMREGLRVCKDGAPMLVFCDWRQIADVQDIAGQTGWINRGLLVWDKVNSRPQLGRPRQDAEFIVFASKGAMPRDRESGYASKVAPGVYRHNVVYDRNRAHMTVKPLALMRELVRITTPGGVILDPFAGSGTTVIAAALEGYEGMGIEVVPTIAEAARRRVEAECGASLEESNLRQSSRQHA
ncbi:methyltransferase [Clostridia bacterium]|nr:methyltransferase [Clostridia bacterium]